MLVDLYFNLIEIMKRLTLLFTLSLSLSVFCSAQGTKQLAEAERYFGIRNYEEALPRFLDAIQAGEKDAVVHFKAGVCYQKSTEIGLQSKAIPYFEYAVKNGAPVPNSIHSELGDLYLRNEELQKAIDS
jgi:tetratricopeptide (TPR) repeat protein